VCNLQSMLRFSTTLPGVTRSGHRRAGITIAVGLTGAAPIGSLRTMASLRRGMTQQQQTRATAAEMKGVATVCLGSLPRTVASLRRASTAPPAPTNPKDHKHPSSPVNPDGRGNSLVVTIIPLKFDNWSAAALVAFVLWVLTVQPEYGWKEAIIFLFAFYAGMAAWWGVLRFLAACAFWTSFFLRRAR
jgi:hypothetical protein